MKKLMKIFGAFLIASVVLSSCSDSGWSQKEKDTFMGTCVVPGVTNDAYCSCMLKKIEKKYPDPEKYTINMEEMTKWASECPSPQ